MLIYLYVSTQQIVCDFHLQFIVKSEHQSKLSVMPHATVNKGYNLCFTVAGSTPQS
jgi:hypothetical protein